MVLTGISPLDTIVLHDRNRIFPPRAGLQLPCLLPLDQAARPVTYAEVPLLRFNAHRDYRHPFSLRSVGSSFFKKTRDSYTKLVKESEQCSEKYSMGNHPAPNAGRLGNIHLTAFMISSIVGRVALPTRN